MSKPNQSLLNGAYVALPNPASQLKPTSDRRPRFRKAIKVVVHVVAALCLTVVVLWLVFRPKEIKVYAMRAEMTRFDLTGSNNLNYNLSIRLVLRNPNKGAVIYYDWLHACSYFDGKRFGSVMLSGFHQSYRSIEILHPVFEGQSLMPLSNLGVEKFGKERREGLFDVEVRIHAWIRYKIGCFKTSPGQMARIRCELNRVPLGANGSFDGGFRGTRCHIDI